MGQSLLYKFRNFLRGDDGAVTVDWVVLTAAVVSFGMIAGTIIWGETGNAAANIATFIGDRDINTTTF